MNEVGHHFFDHEASAIIKLNVRQVRTVGGAATQVSRSDI
jgi:hypothetical protein